MRIALIADNKVKQIVGVESLDELAVESKKWQATIQIDGLVPEPQVGWILENSQLVSTSGVVSSVPVNRRISKLALLNRFTPSEIGAYYTAIEANIGLKVLDRKLFAAEFIDLDRPDTIYGVNVLASAGIITSERATQILTAEPNDSEIYKGR